MDWTIKDYQHANHPPNVVVNGITGKDVVSINAAVKEPDLKEMGRSRLSLNPSLQKAAEFFGEAEEFRC
jgi:hypothetical protein